VDDPLVGGEGCSAGFLIGWLSHWERRMAFLEGDT
jgi:hypothetical protein